MTVLQSATQLQAVQVRARTLCMPATQASTLQAV
jgi:hypothetical protein